MRSEDEARFRDMARRQAAPMRRFAYLLCGDWHLAEDLVQNALTKLYSAWWRIRGAESLDRYVRKTVVRCWLDEVRRPWRRAEDRTGVVPDVADHDGDPAAVGQRAQTRDLVLRALAEVPSRQRAVLVLRYFEDLSVADTAAALGCSQGTVKSQAARGLDNLRAVITRLGVDESALAGGRTES
ncbi:RNA polymerase sigma factor [Allokutzneria oryzae]|uniref:RNA polymerase sigma factor n=1 Tax=Allokutzneria oryzae TaxID=1378989 RepID=A0ABV6A335_9PSEU